MADSNSTPPGSTGVIDEKEHSVERVEHIATHDRVPGHENYYEKNGLRTYGDGEDHDHEPTVSPFDRLGRVSSDLLSRCPLGASWH